MVELPQQLVPNSTATEVTDLPPVEVSSFPAVAVTVSPQPIQTQELPRAGLTRLYGPAQPDGQLDSPRVDLLYTVPATPPMLTVLRQILIANISGATSWITLGINGVATANLILHEYAIAANSFTKIDVEIPLSAGETIEGYQQVAGDNTVTLIGTVTEV